MNMCNGQLILFLHGTSLIFKALPMRSSSMRIYTASVAIMNCVRCYGSCIWFSQPHTYISYGFPSQGERSRNLCYMDRVCIFYFKARNTPYLFDLWWISNSDVQQTAEMRLKLCCFHLLAAVLCWCFFSIMLQVGMRETPPGSLTLSRTNVTSADID